ncbi:PHB depolymerase family esterase [Gordonia sp. CPCC 206044]|uniref:alpha/beta hydrolase family esterase n=1 Tax=Gordonia sp. CPCC 206044 TaxID=3140793 RepID=UPI003AF37C13
MGIRMTVGVVALVVGVMVGQSAPAIADPAAGASMVTRTYVSEHGSRDYQVFTPHRDMRGRPLIVWLHGATEVAHGDSRTLRADNSLVRLADRYGYAVVAPNQSLRANPQGAWNIFDPAGMVRGGGEAAIIAGIIRRATRELGTDRARTYVVGHSAGAGMTQYIGALYPELVTAVAPVAGWPYLFDPTGTAVTVAMGEHRKRMPAFIVQGDRDDLSVPAFGAMQLAAAKSVNGIDPLAPPRRAVVRGTDPYRTVLESFGGGRVVYANVLGAGHPTGRGGVTLSGPALDQILVSFLLAQR